MKKEFILISSFFYIIISLSSCESVVDIDIPDREVRLVLNSITGSDNPITGNVSLSRFILDDEPSQNVEEALVNLYEGDRLLQSTLTDVQGNFTFENYPEAAKKYTLTVDKEGYSSVEATALLPAQVAIQSVEVDPSVLEALGCKRKEMLSPEQTLELLQNNTEFTLYFKDQANQKNFYGISARIKAKIKEKKYLEDGSVKDSVFFLDFPARMETRDPALNGEEKLDGKSGLTNAEEFIFDDSIFEGETHGFKFKIIGNEFYPEGKVLKLKIYFRLKSISEEQYLYMKSKKSQDQNEGNPFAEPVPIYNNVENGFGIFAAYTVHTTRFPQHSRNN